MTELKCVNTPRSKKPRKNEKSIYFCESLKKVLLGSFIFVRYYFDLLVDKAFGAYYNRKREFIICSSDPLILESATSLSRKIKKRQLKVEDVVTAYIKRIKEVNSVINAVIDNRFNEALSEARNIDKDIATGNITDADLAEKPLLGIPFTSKESTAAKGLSHTFGLVVRKGKKATEDAEVIRLVKEAGGILLGVTNIPQLNLWQESSNPVYGLTRNPYNSTRNVGGSSGGEASIIAAGGSPIGIGSDIGGSLRIPAFMCGVYGHKPTSDLINTRGLTYRTGNEKDTIVVAGPMTKYAEDLTPLLKVLLGKNASKLHLDKHVQIEDIKVYYIDDPKDPFISSIRNEMKEVFKKVVDHFQEVLPIAPEKVEFEGTKYGGKLWRYWMTQEPNADFKRDLTDRQGEVSTWKALIKYLLMFNEYSMSTIFNLVNASLPKEKAEWAKLETTKLKNQLLDKLGDNSVLLYPSGPWPANYHHSALLRPWNFNIFSIWNVLKFPATQVPLGLSEEGLPLGIQIIAKPYQDHLTIAVAKHLEQHFGGYVPPFEHNS